MYCLGNNIRSSARIFDITETQKYIGISTQEIENALNNHIKLL